MSVSYTHLDVYKRQEQERQVVTVARAIMDQRQDRVLGIIVIELDPDMFSNLLLGNQGLFQYQYLFIVDQKGASFFSPFLISLFHKTPPEPGIKCAPS